jgi:aryl-alcohol dehydrogenase-like predicted oxidoreductase
MRRAIELGFFDVMLVKYNLDNKDKLDEVLAEAKHKQNMGFMAMKVVKKLNEKKKYDKITNAIRETIKNPNVDSLLIGMANFEELRMNLAALSV